MKNKLILKVGLAISLIILFAFSANAANSVTDIDIKVTLNKDGSAKIEQEWEGYFSEGTECYYEFVAGDRLDIKNFKVSLNGKDYKTLNSWDVDKSFSQKSYTCGLNYIGRNTYEVCWGISEYGTNTYSIEYTVVNVVGAYEESDGFNFRFINPGMNTGPTDARIEFKLADGTPITDEICNIWGFGYDGEINFYDGAVIGSTIYPIGYSNHMTIMMEFSKGIFNPSYVVDGTFESEVKEPAFDGSSYEDYENSAGFELYFILAVVIGVPILIFVVSGIRKLIQKAKKKKIEKNAPYYRDVPKEDINVSYTLLNYLGDCDESAIISARILRLIDKGVITPVNDDNEGKIFSKRKVSFRINPLSDISLEHWDKKLYEILKASAGDDGILEPLEMKLYCRDHPSTLRSFLRRCKVSGEEGLDELRCSKNGKYSAVSNLSVKGTEMLSELYGFKKYLLEFSLIDERTVNDVHIWQDYMVYAALFGIADKVADQLVKIYPEEAVRIEVYRRDVIFANTCRHHMYSNMVKTERAMESQRAAKGSGGRVSFGGGGGFSGGGFGGGTR